MAGKDIRSTIAARASAATEAIRDHGGAAANATYRAGKAALQTKNGKRAALGAAAGGAIGAALPFVTLAAGALLGAGALVLWKNMKEND